MMVVKLIVLTYQVTEVLQRDHQVHLQVHRVQVKVLVEEEQQGEIKMDGYIIIVLLVLVVLGGYWLFFGGEDY